MEIQLDSRQAEAVESNADAVLVLAGPGAGKTRVIVQRIIHLIEQREFEPGRIVAVTFTNRAADEMRRRLLARSPDYEPVRVSTLHSFAMDIIKRHHEKSVFTKRPVVFDEVIQDRLIRNILRQMGLSTETFPLRRLKNVVDFAKANLAFPLASERFPPEFENELREILIDYQRALLEHNAMDFSDILLTALEILHDPAVRETEQCAIDYFLIDEFQDINLSEYALILAVNPPSKPIFTVADEDQTIYNWRGSSSRFIRLFREDYDPEIIDLVHNWRCAKPIIQAAKVLIAHNRTCREPEIHGWDPGEETEPQITLFQLNDEKEEQKLILKLIANARAGGIDLSEVAILARTHFLLNNLHRELVLNNIPSVRISKESDEIPASDLISYLELTRSLNEWDVETTLRFPRRCLTSLDEIRILREARTEGENSLWGVLKRSTRDPRLGPLSRKRIAELLELIGEMPNTIEETGLSRAIYNVLQMIGKRRSPLKSETRAELIRAQDEIEFDPAINIDKLRDIFLQAKTLSIIHAPDFLGLTSACIIAETALSIFGTNSELIPYSDVLKKPSGKSPIISIGLNSSQLRTLFPDTLISDVTCISPGKIHLPADADDETVPDYRLPLAAYALCYRLTTPKLPDDDIEIVFFDLETTGVNTRRADIVEIAAVRYLLHNGRLQKLNSYQTLVKPPKPIPPAATAVHKITNAMVADAPAIEGVIEPFLEFIGDAMLAGHNIEGYDLPILRRFAGRILRRDIPNPTLDSLIISRRLLPKVSHTLGDLAAMLDVTLDNAHRALADVIATADVTEILLEKEAGDIGLDFSNAAINLLAAGFIWDETSPDRLTDLLVEAASRSAMSNDAKIEGFDALTGHAGERFRDGLAGIAKLVRSTPVVNDEEDDRFEAMRRRVEDEAVLFTERYPVGTLADFLDYYTLLSEEECAPDEEAIRLLSLHSAKGLEFDTVIIIGLEQGNLPHYLALGHADRVEEERRLFYVGLTRASRKVYLTSIRQRDGMHRSASMFLSEIPDPLLKQLHTPRK